MYDIFFILSPIFFYERTKRFYNGKSTLRKRNIKENFDG